MKYDDSLIKTIVNEIKTDFQKVNLDEEILTDKAKSGFRKASKDGFEDDDLVEAAGYWGAHLCYIIQNGNEHVKSESAAVLSREYFDKSDKDDFLNMYNNLLNDLLTDNGKTNNRGFFL